jgi:hypothetical protein
VKRVRLYVEGGGQTSKTRLPLRDGLKGFLESALGAKARRLHVIVCGAAAVAEFQRALRTHADHTNLLLVDSEGPMTASPKARVSAGRRAKFAGDESQYHLMVQAFEAWLIADPQALADFYGPRFRRGSLPRRRNVEDIPKDDLEPKLRAATRATQKGEYHKIRHAAPLLERLDAVKVRVRAEHCDRLFCVLEATLAELP